MSTQTWWTLGKSKWMFDEEMAEGWPTERSRLRLDVGDTVNEVDDR